MMTSKLETKTSPKARATARTSETRWKTMLGHGTEVEGNMNGRVATRNEEAMYPALTWAVTAVPLPPLLLRRRFHRDRRVTFSFLDRATSSPGTRTFWTASHIACTVRDDQRHKFQLILEER
jgi:hypothetical protein